MKIAVGIIALVLSMIALMQSCTVTTLSGLADDVESSGAGALGMMTAILMFFGGAFSFGLPKVARIIFALGFLVSIPARAEYPDMLIWGIASLILGVLLFFIKNKNPE